MAKTQEELLQIKKEYDELKEKLSELSQEDLEVIAGGKYKEEIGKDKNAKVIFK